MEELLDARKRLASGELNHITEHALFSRPVVVKVLSRDCPDDLASYIVAVVYEEFYVLKSLGGHYSNYMTLAQKESLMSAMLEDVEPKVRELRNWVTGLNEPDNISGLWASVLFTHWRLPGMSTETLKVAPTLADFGDTELQEVYIDADEEEYLLERHEEYICGELGVNSLSELRDPFFEGHDIATPDENFVETKKIRPAKRPGWKVQKRWHASAR